MFAMFKRLVGIITVTETTSHIIIDGVDGNMIALDFEKTWGTTRINKFMFSMMSRNKIVFPKFFAIDVLYMLESMMDEPRPRYPKRSYQKIIDEMLTNTWLKDIQQPSRVNRLNFDRVDEITFKLLPHQMEFLENYNRVVSTYHLGGMMLAAAPGSGKACRASTLVKVPDGWRRIDKLAIGSEVVAYDGSVSKVTGVYPQGKLQLYRVEFVDGRFTDVCGDHLWTVTNRNDKNREWVTQDTKILIENLKRPNNHIHIPLITPDESEDVFLPIDPYLLGVLIGDGSIVGRSVTFSTPDQHIVEEVSKRIPRTLTVKYAGGYDYRITSDYVEGHQRYNPLKERLTELGLQGCRSHEKFIPFTYKTGSKAQRLSLLQGLLDTDGTVGKHGNVSYSTSSSQLAKDIQWLVWSLGGICKIAEKKPFYTYQGERKEGRLSYVLHIRMKNPAESFTLPKKKDRLNEKNQYSDNLRLRIKSITPIDVDDAVCISIDHPSKLYVVEDFVVTHNTITGLALASCLEADFVIIISPKNAVERVWADTLRNNMTLKPEFWYSTSPIDVPPAGLRYYVFHYEALDRALELVKRSRFTKAMVILDESHNFNEIGSQRTQRFIQLCKEARSRDVVWASGTPIKAIGFESIPFLKTIDNYFNADAEERFRKIFGKDAKRANDILRNRIGLVSFKVNKQEIVKIESEEHEVKVKIPNGEYYTLDVIRDDMKKFIDERLKFYQAGMKEYTKLYDDCLNIHQDWVDRAGEHQDFRTYKQYIRTIRDGYDPELHKTEAQFCNRYELTKIMPSLPDHLRKPFKNVRSIIKYVNLKVMGEALGGILGKRRSKCHVEMIPHMGLPELIDQVEKKTVVFSSYVEAVDEMARYMEGQGYKPLVVHGGTNKDLARIVERFEKDPDINPLLATYQSLSTAVPLVMANGVILTNAPFREYEKNQAVSRALRLGQTHKVHIYNVFLDTGAKGNISTRSKDILQWSEATVASIMGVEVPSDLGTALESMMESPMRMEESAERFIANIRKQLPLDCVAD